jgi:hypothetical protein
MTLAVSGWTAWVACKEQARAGYDGKGVGVAVIDSGTTLTADLDNPKRLEQDKLKGQQDGSALNDPYGPAPSSPGSSAATASTATTSASHRTRT